MLAERLSRVRERIHEACQRSGRAPESVTLVAVTKTVPVELIREAIALGVTDIGENRVQEARIKREALGQMRNAECGMRSEEQRHSEFRIPNSELGWVRWHMVGHLQRNKAKDAVELFDVIHSVDSVELAEELERQTARTGQATSDKGQATKEAAIEVFIQVNVSGEATKSGCNPDEVNQLAQAVQRSPHLQWRGLMTIPPFSDDPEDARPHFRRLRDLRDELQRSLHSAFRIPHSALLLSMGMSHDFEVAIEEGADVVRIGTAIFATSDKGQATS
ncbi:MAG: YggS family pyridoxal phosphate enzyme [Omnitrophica WOR_2 bacterium RIFCSPLOWO2_02_FULL_63_16]|nr:MAG: YggS family pyridoxal phosphate enzyme [Omnitrophica WOR_2 bacterium GWF2_63_9]OGX31831.1 MAG: YggS family pyridoxal phosphate enzyme [Omnitrophica WOR_2 bacterium RIFCSPHIGHO2_12_FULL_64_13]OGX35102.1 MAG: YggS family pyridoxal phosphate enzyme [Omnitrophica WOR_2 bacterium RIFCSPHIGHO2_02_FULL_63_39]OGX44408.1 MAG: YggS family pyridoxal phosphate enzyme [Omnitrophica WOR_2 bacterium RIFCSPLOWO2_02_FULL_63_16]OGX48636.1 MAG: YggS family pyridoxal phosphate enzyme [Omnitrophica WOR_2 ba